MSPDVRSPGRATLPADLGFAIAASAHVCDDGATLLAHGRVLRLSPPAAALVRQAPLTIGDDPVAARLARRLIDAGVADPWWADAPPADRDVHDVTVVVPVHDRPEALARLLAALPPHLEVVVVDDGSPDPGPTRAVAERYAARLIRHPVNRGPAAARNTGLAATRTPWVLFCDSDVQPVPGWLGVLRRHGGDPGVGLVAPRVLGHEEDPRDGWLVRYEQARSSLDLGPEPAGVRIRGPVAYVPTACLLARVEALGAGFAEDLRAGEDVDLVWRLLEEGWRVRYEPAARVRHDHRAVARDWLARKAFYGTSAAPLARRHPGAVAPMVLSGWSAVLTVAVLAQRRWSAPVAGLALASALIGVRRRLDSPHPWQVAGTLVAEGAVASVWQTSAALLRHHWPIAALVATRSSRARRALLVAGVLDAVADRRRTGARVPLPVYVVLRRADDLAYGWGLWVGAVRERSPAALLPVITGTERWRGAVRRRLQRLP